MSTDDAPELNYPLEGPEDAPVLVLSNSFYAGCCAAIRDMDTRDRLPAIEAPTLVVSAAEDPATPPEYGELIRGAIPGAHLEVIPWAAHSANVEQPERIARLILTHLEER